MGFYFVFWGAVDRLGTAVPNESGLSLDKWGVWTSCFLGHGPSRSVATRSAWQRIRVIDWKNIVEIIEVFSAKVFLTCTIDRCAFFEWTIEARIHEMIWHIRISALETGPA